ncbi:right-handed parallel beta-helix repeat-containing protein [Anatilimnocola floriformis]|uniref:right-handed parallel beta-helix repeat-containing protein n=1 Tax=Anatilimnocola floriformis TaxID=2948575 RepID=UPI0020C4E275|nr:right-handed parallel beta-helix repeat-containing protein [Anatilimnocola floriformis]
MGKVVCFLTALLVGSANLLAADGHSWYVAPAGDDTAAGDLEHPFASITRAQKSAAAGDTVYLRGGTYKPTDADVVQTRGIFAHLFVLDKSGERDKPITYSAYREERPVFDCSSVKPEGKRVSIFYVSGNWLRLIGIEITGAQVTIKTHTQSICIESQGNHNIFERLALHDGQAIGVYHVRGSDNLFLNCDAWNNRDYTSEDGKGGNVDGFGGHPSKGSTGNVFRGCRAWYNSDDGYDCINAHESVTFENCWAMGNGLSPMKESLADGNGFKAGGYGSTPAERVPNPLPRHVVRFCIAVGNKNSGFYANHHLGGCDWLNNSAFRNGANFNMLGRLADNRTDIDGVGHVLRNNLSYGGRRDLARMNAEKCTAENNSFTLETKLTDKNFLSLDTTELFQPRGKDGSLPDINCLRPAAKISFGALPAREK